MINSFTLYDCIPYGVNLTTDALRAFYIPGTFLKVMILMVVMRYAIAQKAKCVIPQFDGTGIMEIDHQNDVIQMHLQKAGCIHSSLSFLR